jgi:hypothetical protein
LVLSPLPNAVELYVSQVLPGAAGEINRQPTGTHRDGALDPGEPYRGPRA